MVFTVWVRGVVISVHALGLGCSGQRGSWAPAVRGSEFGYPLLLKPTEVPLLLRDVPLSTFVSVGSAVKEIGVYCLGQGCSYTCLLFCSGV